MQKENYNKIKEIWNEFVAISNMIVDNDYVVFCEVMNEAITNKFIDKEKLIDIIILDGVIDKCRKEVDIIKSIINNNYNKDNNDIEYNDELKHVKVNPIDAYILYSNYMDEVTGIVKEISNISFDSLIRVIDEDIKHLSQFVSSFYQIYKIISQYINSIKLEYKKIHYIADDIKPIEIEILTKKEEIDILNNEYAKSISTN